MLTEAQNHLPKSSLAYINFPFLEVAPLSPLGREHINLTGRLPVAKHQEDRQRHFQAYAVALTYDMVRFLRGPLLDPVGEVRGTIVPAWPWVIGC